MPAIATSDSRPYVSRRKRRRFSEESPLLGNRTMLGVLGLLLLGLLVSLVIIAVQLISPEPADTAYYTISAVFYNAASTGSTLLIG